MNKQFENLLNRIVPTLLSGLEKYFRVEIQGLKNLPDSQCIVFANHSGFTGFDAVMLSYGINKNTKRLFRMVTHPLWFQTKLTSEVALKYGMIFASFESMEKELQDGQSLIIFPEGEDGNFKSSREMYSLQDFRTGLARIALKYQIPVVPCTIIGAEESNLNLSRLEFKKFFPKGLKIPLPFNIIPLPTKWYIHIHPSISTSKYNTEYHRDTQMVVRISKLWKKRLQIYLYRDLKKRPGVFINRKKWIDRILN